MIDLYVYVYRDAPNAWPPHQYIILQALRTLPPTVTETLRFPKPSNSQSSFAFIPPRQLGLTEIELPGQPMGYDTENNVVIIAPRSGTYADLNQFVNGSMDSASVYGINVNNGGHPEAVENWSTIMQRELANRYFTSVMCSW